MTQRELRIHTYSVLFSIDFAEDIDSDQICDNYLDSLVEEDEDELNDRGLSASPVMDERTLYQFKSRVADIISCLPDLDKKIADVAEGWSLNRMTRADRTALRLGAYEMLCDDDIPVRVAINEAVEIAKIYGGPKSPSFVNGVLAKLVTE